MGGRPGYVLVAVLWTMAGAVALGAVLALTSREAIGAARNRVSLARARWEAEGCIERARAVIGEALGERRDMPPSASSVSSWLLLDSIVARSPITAGCSLLLRPSGLTLDANSAAADELRALLRNGGIEASRADSLVDALMDWRDVDDTVTSLGAEREWYRRERHPDPRNGPIASRQELRRIRGFAALQGLDTLLGVANERIFLARAPAAVLGALPGMTEEAVATLLQLRTNHAIDVAALAGSLSPGARSVLLAHYAELAQRTTSTPDAWNVIGRASSGVPSVTASIELRLVNAGARAAVVRRQEWP
jgi:type II secretory pathway component PulK